MAETIENIANTALAENGANSTNGANGTDVDTNAESGTNVADLASNTNGVESTDCVETVDLMEMFIEKIIPLLSGSEESKQASINKLRAAVVQKETEDPKFRQRKFYKGLFQELLYVIEARNFMNAHTLLKEAIEEVKYNADTKPNLGDRKLEKQRVKQIKKLKAKLWKAHKKIQIYMEREVDLNDENFEEANTAFVKQQRECQKAIRLERQIKSLMNKPLMTGSINEKKYSFKGSPYPQINTAITNLVNERLTESHTVSQVSDRRQTLLAAPDFATLRELIVKTMDEHHISIVDVDDFSKKMLRKIGDDLKHRRRTDCEYGFESYLRLESIKPKTVVAKEEEVALEEKFKEHVEKAVSDTENIIRHFEERERESGEQGESSGVDPQELQNGSIIDEIMGADDEEEDDSISDSESDLDDEKENEQDSSDAEMIDESDDDADDDDDVEIIDVVPSSTANPSASS